MQNRNGCGYYLTPFFSRFLGYPNNLGGGGTLLGLLYWSTNLDEISTFCQNHPKAFSLSLILLCIIIGWLTSLLIKSHKENNDWTSKLNEEIEKIHQQNIYEGTKPREPHTILIVDDDNRITKLLREELDQGFKVLTLERIEDYRLAAEFEIIVSDLLDCSRGQTAESTLNMIKQKYPYKFIVPMSTEPAACKGLNVDTRIIKKGDTPSDYRFISEVRDTVVSLAKELDNVDQHWNNVYNQLRRENMPEDQIEAIKSKYYRFVNNM